MTDHVFLHAALCQKQLLDIVLGRPHHAEAAILTGHHILWADRALPELRPDPAALEGVEGQVLLDVDANDLKRITYFHACFGQIAGVVHIVRVDRDCTAITFLGPEEVTFPENDGTADEWSGRFSDTLIATTREIMQGFDQIAPKAMLARLSPLLVRGASRARVLGEHAPSTLRRSLSATDVAVASITAPYARFFSVEEYDLQFRRFDGAFSPSVTRAAFISGDAVTVLPYDPHRDRVLVVEQFRAGPLARGDAQMWQLEAIAGRIDPGETPAEAARREALEEAGLTLDAVLEVARYYPSPGAVSEYVYSYIALADLPDGTGGIFGVEDEAEDIRSHLIDFEQLMGLVTSGEVANAPLILTAFWLDRERPRLRNQPQVQTL